KSASWSRNARWSASVLRTRALPFHALGSMPDWVTSWSRRFLGASSMGIASVGMTSGGRRARASSRGWRRRRLLDQELGVQGGELGLELGQRGAIAEALGRDRGRQLGLGLRERGVLLVGRVGPRLGDRLGSLVTLALGGRDRR